MRLLILDYFRRRSRFWMLLLALSGVELGHIIASDPRDAVHAASDVIPGLIQVTAIFGLIPLSNDLARGLARCASSLPLTSAQIGRALWIVAVPTPVIVGTALLSIGAAFYDCRHPSSIFPGAMLAGAFVFGLLWLGAGFTVLFQVSVTQSGAGWVSVIRGGIFGVALAAMTFGPPYYLNYVLARPLATAIVFGVAAVATCAGWLLAGQFVMARATFRPGKSLSIKPGDKFGATPGYGGIPRFISTTFVRGFLATVGFVALLTVMECQTESWRKVITSTDGMLVMGGPGCVVIILLLLPALTHLRFLRTLPISPGALAAVLIGMVVLPTLAAGLVLAGVAGFAAGTPAASQLLLNAYVLWLSPAALGVVVAVWLGVSQRSTVVQVTLLITLAPSIVGIFFHTAKVPFLFSALFAGASGIVAFLLTRYSLTESSRPYKVVVNVPGTTA